MDTLVTTDWLARQLEEPDLVVLGSPVIDHELSIRGWVEIPRESFVAATDGPVRRPVTSSRSS